MTTKPVVSSVKREQLIWIGISVLLIIACVFSFTDLKPTKKQETVDINTPVTLGGVTYTVKSYETTSKYNGHSTQGSFVVVTVEAKNDSKKAISISPEQFLLKDSANREYKGDSSRDIKIFGERKHFSITDDINPGLSRTGVVSFEVPSADGNYSLAIRDNMFDFGGAEYVNVRLK